MTSARRWLVVALGVCLLCALPFVGRALPVSDSSISAARLLARVERSSQAGYSGYAQVKGNIQLPVTDRFSGLAKLLGDSSELRVWWRASDDWRVDSITTTGETDLIRSGVDITSWRYESTRVIRSTEPEFRLPRTSDFVPAVLGRRLVNGAAARDVSRLRSRRVAGHTVPGLRIRPHDSRSTVDHVDLWADEDTGVVLDVRAYGKGDATPAASAHFVTVELGRPAASTTSFVAPQGARVSFERALDIGSAADQFAPVRPPSRLIGLARDPSRTGAVGQYGSGQTVVIAIPLWRSAADQLRQQLERTPGSALTDNGVFVGVGPVTVELTDGRSRGGDWLLIGTVTKAALDSAASELRAVER